MKQQQSYVAAYSRMPSHSEKGEWPGKSWDFAVPEVSEGPSPERRDLAKGQCNCRLPDDKQASHILTSFTKAARSASPNSVPHKQREEQGARHTFPLLLLHFWELRRGGTPYPPLPAPEQPNVQCNRS